MDIACCVAALPVFALAVVTVTLITRATSPGPILFRQEHVGCRGRRFLIYRFRTMRVHSDAAVHQPHASQRRQRAVREADRWIPGGWLMRASGFSELPQIINVLRGEMSIVGPRPCVRSAPGTALSLSHLAKT